MAQKIFFSGVAVCFVLSALFYYGYTQNFYQTLLWWDIFMHALGGMWAGYISAWFAVMAGKPPRLVYFVAGALVLGACVEILEYFITVGRNPFMSYELDTAKDFIVDALGGAIAYYLILREKA